MDTQNPTSWNWSKFYIYVGRISGWVSVCAFALGTWNKVFNMDLLFSPSDLLQAAMYLILFAIFASMASVSSR